MPEVQVGKVESESEKVMRCSVCRHEMTSQEAATYKTRCEDCAMSFAPDGASSSKKPGARTSKIDQGAAEIVRLWGDIEVRDSTADLRVMILPEDVEKATRKDPACCVFAQACKRSFGSTKILFLRSIAYVELPNENGTSRVERFQMPPTMRALIESFDRGEAVIPKAGFLLKKITPGRSFNHLIKKERRRKERMRQAELRGTVVERRGNQGVGKYRDKPITVDLSVRNGSGTVHFIAKKEAE